MRSPQNLLQPDQPQLSQPVFIGEVLDTALQMEYQQSREAKFSPLTYWPGCSWCSPGFLGSKHALLGHKLYLHLWWCIFKGLPAVYICIVEVAGPVVLAVMTISEVAGVGTCCGWNASLTRSGISLTPTGTFWVVKPAKECNAMSLLVATQLDFMQLPGSTGSARLILTYKVKHGLCVFEELLPKTAMLMWKQQITFFRDICLSLRSTWPGLSSNADGFCYRLTWSAKGGSCVCLLFSK